MKKILLCLLCAVQASISYSKVPKNVLELYEKKYYIGGAVGSGYTTWGGLVPSEENRNVAMSVSTPILVREGGAVWGLFGGYEISPYFAIEANYMDYPEAVVTFDEDSLFAFEHDGLTKLRTNTQTGSLMAKIMLIIPESPFRLYSAAGIAGVWRKDEVNTANRVSPTFSFGVTLNPSKWLMFEVGSNYTAGYGESEINPANHFIPFVYSFYGKAAIRFNTVSS